MRRCRHLLPIVALGVVSLACGTDETQPGATSTEVPSTVSLTVPETSAAPVDEPTETASTQTVGTTTAAPTSTTAAPYPTTTLHQVPDDCDVDGMFAVVESDMAVARLAPGGDWSTETEGVTFDERTNDAEEFRYRMALDCMVRASQVTDSGDQRLLLAAWTGDRNAYVLQATDGPTSPYEADQLFELLVEQPRGEWIVDQFVWAGTLDGGETVIVGADDNSIAVAAKSFLSGVPRFEDLPVTIAVERYGIDALVHAGARNVSVAEPAVYDSELSALQMVTPLGLRLIPTIAGVGWFDPTIELFPGTQTIETARGVEIYVTNGASDAYAIASVGWECDDHVWYFDSLYGTVDELVDWAKTVIGSVGCTG